jgi:hypothetical protein
MLFHPTFNIENNKIEFLKAIFKVGVPCNKPHTLKKRWLMALPRLV